MQDPDRYFEYRVRYLPKQLDAARKKVEMLENEARRYGLTELLRTDDREPGCAPAPRSR